MAGTCVVPCCLGPAGITRRKREGDGATPAGRFRLEALLFRADRGVRPQSGLGGRRLQAGQGWCDDAASASYNRPVTLPFRPSHERLWRDDGVYDLLVVIDYNRAPVRRAHGSAIFMHLQQLPPRPTAGCVALAPAALRVLLRRIGRRTRIVIA